jgi:hypothetical protein
MQECLQRKDIDHTFKRRSWTLRLFETRSAVRVDTCSMLAHLDTRSYRQFIETGSIFDCLDPGNIREVGFLIASWKRYRLRDLVMPWIQVSAWEWLGCRSPAGYFAGGVRGCRNLRPAESLHHSPTISKRGFRAHASDRPRHWYRNEMEPLHISNGRGYSEKRKLRGHIFQNLWTH